MEEGCRSFSKRILLRKWYNICFKIPKLKKDFCPLAHGANALAITYHAKDGEEIPTTKVRETKQRQGGVDFEIGEVIDDNENLVQEDDDKDLA